MCFDAVAEAGAAGVTFSPPLAHLTKPMLYVVRVGRGQSTSPKERRNQEGDFNGQALTLYGRKRITKADWQLFRSRLKGTR